MLAEDFIGISMSGQVNTKAQQLERVRTRKLVVSKVELSDMKVKLVGSIAIVTCQAEVEGTSESGSVKGLVPLYEDLPASGVRETGRSPASRRPGFALRKRTGASMQRPDAGKSSGTG